MYSESDLHLLEQTSSMFFKRSADSGELKLSRQQTLFSEDRNCQSEQSDDRNGLSSPLHRIGHFPLLTACFRLDQCGFPLNQSDIQKDDFEI